MSWDVSLFKGPAGMKAISDLPRDYEVLTFDRAVAIAKISALFPGTVDFSNPSWGTVIGDGWSMEVNIGDNDVCSSMMLHIRGGGDPVTAALKIADALELTPIDCSSGDILTLEDNCFSKWRDYRDQVVVQSSPRSIFDRIAVWFRGGNT